MAQTFWWRLKNCLTIRQYSIDGKTKSLTVYHLIFKLNIKLENTRTVERQKADFLTVCKVCLITVIIVTLRFPDNIVILSWQCYQVIIFFPLKASHTDIPYIIGIVLFKLYFWFKLNACNFLLKFLPWISVQSHDKLPVVL
jgi:hypothetical protein